MCGFVAEESGPRTSHKIWLVGCSLQVSAWYRGLSHPSFVASYFGSRYDYRERCREKFSQTLLEHALKSPRLISCFRRRHSSYRPTDLVVCSIIAVPQFVDLVSHLLGRHL